MFPPFVDFAEKVRLFEAHFVQNADIIHRRFRLVNRRDKLFFTAFGCVRLKTLTRQKQISTVLFRDVFLPFSLSECVRHQKTTWIARIPQEGRAWSHWSSLWPLMCWYFADILQKTVLPHCRLVHCSRDTRQSGSCGRRPYRWFLRFILFPD